jgi:hypothetical protein
MMTRHGLALAFLLLASTACFGQDRAEKLLMDCTSSDAGTRVACLSYLSGFFDGSEMQSALTDSRLICWPDDGVSGFQLKQIVVKWLQDHPKDLNQRARIQVMLAFKDAFPCKK